MPVISKLYLDEVELLLEDLPEDIIIVVTKVVSEDGDEYYNVEVEDEALFEDLKEILENE